jgi:hypothetical protein
MRALEFDELAAWCEHSGYRLEDWRPAVRLPEDRATVLPSGDSQELAAMIDALVNAESIESERLIWISEWQIWNDRSQEIGLRHLNLLVDRLLENANPSQSHIYLFNPAEWREAIALLTVPVLYGWDAYLFFGSGAVLIEVSHDGPIEVSLGHGADISRFRALLK